MTLRRILVSILSLMLGVGFAQPVHASVLTISGTITTPSGVPVEGVSVSDGTPPNALTNADGYYSLQQMQFGTYTLTVTKAGLTSESANVTLSPTNPSATRNFIVAYLSSLDLPDPYISTEGHAESLYATLRTYAPNPESESCAKITDSRTGNTVAMTHIGTEAGREVWRYTPSLPANSTEGNFTLNARVDDCATSPTRIDTGAQQRTYLIDNTSPALYGYAPQDLGNCLAPCQELTVIVSDSGSGINSASASLQLYDGEISVAGGSMTVGWINGVYTRFTMAVPALMMGGTYRG